MKNKTIIYLLAFSICLGTANTKAVAMEPAGTCQIGQAAANIVELENPRVSHKNTTHAKIVTNAREDFSYYWIYRYNGIEYQVAAINMSGRTGSLHVTGVSGNPRPVIYIPSVIVINGISFSVTEIREKTFYKNNFIRKVVLGDNIRTVGRNAFSNCSRLNSVIFGKNIKTICPGAFKNCGKLKTIRFKKSSKLDSTGSGFNAFKDSHP